MQKNLHITGVTFVFFYCLVYALSQLFTGHYEQSISAYLLAAYVFLTTLLFYFLVNCLRLKDTLMLISKNCALIIKINISTAFGWLTIIYALKYITPAEALAINFGVLPISTMILSFFNKETTRPTTMDFLFSIILFLFIFLLIANLISKND